MRTKGFTLMELLIVLVIIGILATLSINRYTAYRENALDREAVANLRLIDAAERIWRMENGAGVNFQGCACACAGAGAGCCDDPVAAGGLGCNVLLRLSLRPPGNWQYTVTAAPITTFQATAVRVGGPGACTYTLTEVTPNGAPVPVGAGCRYTP